MNIGDRVGVISHTDEETLYLLGFGVYEGDYPVTSDAGGFNFGQSNPRIKLDNGRIVWGCECWWGPEKSLRHGLDVARREGKKVVEIDIDTLRKNAKGNSHEREQPDQ